MPFTHDVMRSALASYYENTTAHLADLQKTFRDDADFEDAFHFGWDQRQWYADQLTALDIEFVATDTLADLANKFWTNADLSTLAAL